MGLGHSAQCFRWAFMRVGFVFTLRRGWIRVGTWDPIFFMTGVVGPAVDTVSLSMTTEASEALSPFPGNPQAGSLSYVFSRCSRSWLFYIPINRTCFPFCTHLSQDPW